LDVVYLFCLQLSSPVRVDQDVIVGGTVRIVREIDKNVDKNGTIVVSDEIVLILKKN
jgi:hypothetical protein